MKTSSSWWLTSLAVIALLVFMGAGCSFGRSADDSDASPDALSETTDSGLPEAEIVSEPSEQVPGKPAAPEKTKPTSSAGIAELSQTQHVLLTTENAETASLHLQRPGADADTRDTVAEDALFVPQTVVSEDGSTLSYIALRKTRQDVGLVDLDSLEAALVEDAIYTGDDSAVAWNPASTRFVASRTHGLTPSRSLLLFHFDGTGEQLLTPRSEGDADVEPAFSPDGATIAYRRVDADLAGLEESPAIKEGELHVYDLASGKDTLLLEHVHAFEWIDAETLLVWRTPDPRTANEPLQTVSLLGGEPVSLVTTASAFAVTPDRKRVAYATGVVREGFDVSLYDLNKEEVLTTASSFSDGETLPKRPTHLSFSEDGERLSLLFTTGAATGS
ncbi:MAG: PD40 domain-containing protein, partial [Candidatus Andersenbacteria bacterium]|nr:PD40 domain-containing protein [Candidatus Andersenbacteria bacterium]